ncbi:hypothetical protein HK096_005075 [Nowakowskiella sp. JEL0078]|nr:hypothetical protein HK096_005075 [Nowakowskiella sp. JEL0078]
MAQIIFLDESETDEKYLQFVAHIEKLYSIKASPPMFINSFKNKRQNAVLKTFPSSPSQKAPPTKNEFANPICTRNRKTIRQNISTPSPYMISPSLNSIPSPNFETKNDNPLSQVSISNSIEIICPALIPDYKMNLFATKANHKIDHTPVAESNVDLGYLLFGDDNPSDLQTPLSKYLFEDEDIEIFERKAKKRKNYDDFAEFDNALIEISDEDDNFEVQKFQPPKNFDLGDEPNMKYDVPNSPIQGFTNLKDLQKYSRDPKIDLYFKQLETKQMGTDGNKKARSGSKTVAKKSMSGGNFWKRRGAKSGRGGWSGDRGQGKGRGRGIRKMPIKK